MARGGGRRGGLCSDGVVTYEYLSREEADFLYHEIFVHHCYFNCEVRSLSDQHKSDDVREGDCTHLADNSTTTITINDGDCIIDIGSNIGLFSLFCVSTMRNLTIVACEPIPETCAVLRRNLKSYHRTHEIYIEECAIGKSSNKEEMFVFDTSMPGESCRGIHSEEKKQQQDVLRRVKEKEEVKGVYEFVSHDDDIGNGGCISDSTDDVKDSMIEKRKSAENNSKRKRDETEHIILKNNVNNDDDGIAFDTQCEHVLCPVLSLQDLILCTIDNGKIDMEVSHARDIGLLKIDCEGDELEVLLGITCTCPPSRFENQAFSKHSKHDDRCLWGRIRQVVVEVHDIAPPPHSFDSTLECTVDNKIDNLENSIPNGRLQHVVSLLEKKGKYDRVEVRKQHTMVCEETGYTMYIPDELNMYFVFGVRTT